MNPVPTKSSSLIWAYIACNIIYLSTSTDNICHAGQEKGTQTNYVVQIEVFFYSCILTLF